MLLDLTTIENISQADLTGLPSKTLLRRFGQDNDSIELTIYDINNNIIIRDEQFTDYIPYINPQDSLIDSIDIDYVQVLNDYGLENGQYKLVFSFQRKLLTSGFDRPFIIKEISPSRTEIRFKSNNLDSESFSAVLENLLANFTNNSFVKDINLSFPDGVTSLAVNAQRDVDSGLIKLYDPLLPSIALNTPFRIYEEVINALEATVDLGTSKTESGGVELRAPNFDVEFNQHYSTPTEFRTYDELLNNGAVTSSFNNLQNYLSGSISVDLEFDNPNTSTGFHFENFIHFSSATERLKNFKYKLELLESYSSSLATLENITGDASSSKPTLDNIKIFNNKTDKVIQGFDYYERFLYFENNLYAWPKTTTGRYPHINAKVNSAAAQSWLGAGVEDSTNQYYGGQLLSASKFDEINPHNLATTIPPDIRANSENEAYVLFTQMVGQHFDGIWAYIDSIPDKNQAYSGLNDGISKEFVFEALRERGIRAYSQFEDSSIYEYFLGDDGTGTFQYEATDGSTMVSASNDGSIPKGDISKEIWKRLYHNTPYLLKTKGTERGLKALIACYGIPETVLHVKEYGGPLVDKTGFRTFSYQKESRMLSPADDDYVISDTLISRQTSQTLQTRFLPTKGSTTAFDIMSFAGNSGNTNDIVIGISQSLNNTKLDSGSFAHLVIASGSLADPSAGRIKAISSSLLGPIFNGEVWNLSVILNSGSDRGNTIEAFATNTTFNKNTYILSCSLDTPEFFASGAGYPFYITTVGSTKPIGDNSQNGTLLAPFSGSIQEFRSWDEKLTKDTIVTQSLSPFNYNGNTISSSFEALRTRLSLGSCNRDLSLLTGSKNQAPNKTFTDISNNLAQVPSTVTLTTIEETHHLTTPDTVGSGMVSDKIRIDNGTFNDNFLDPFISTETSPQDRQPLDYSDVGVFFSPTFEVNEDIIYTLGGFRLDDYIGDPTHYTSGSYPDLKDIRDVYTQKLDKKLGIGDYIRTIQFFDHSLFKMIKDFVPASANLKTGVVIEPHYLERMKIAGTNVDYEQLTEHLVAPTGMTGSLSSTSENVHDVLIDVDNFILKDVQSSAVENVAQTGRKSRIFSLA
jgi:hypothetical protein